MAKYDSKNVKIQPIYHEYLCLKAGRGKICVTLEDIIQADMQKEENKKFLPIESNDLTKEKQK